MATVSEWGRVLAEEELDSGAFTTRMLGHSIDDYDRLGAYPEDVLFDRGIPDCWAYARWLGVDEGPFIESTSSRRYEEAVLHLPFWPEIYMNDDLRRATPEMARSFDELPADTYSRAGYELIEVPPGTIGTRLSFTRAFLNAG